MSETKKNGAELFESLYGLNVNEKTEKKNGLTYLSWAWAWAEFKKVYPDATYEVIKGADGLPYVFDDNTGYMVFTKVTAGGITHEMWLPVMDGANKAMKARPYSYEVGWGQNKKTKLCDAATMFDVNKAIMRCLTKNLAMFGLGLYIYAGEDLPEGESEPETPKEEPGQAGNKFATFDQIKRIKELIAPEKWDACLQFYKVTSFDHLTYKQAGDLIMKKSKEKG